jgi:hypothetical protein
VKRTNALLLGSTAVLALPPNPSPFSNSSNRSSRRFVARRAGARPAAGRPLRRGHRGDEPREGRVRDDHFLEVDR